MEQQSSAASSVQSPDNTGFPILTFQLRCIWIVFVAATVLVELLPAPDMSRTVLYFVWALKLFSYGLMGFLAPLAFERCNAFVRGLALAAVTSSTVEVLQGLIGNGHSFRKHELVFKLLLIAAGFCMAVVARYEQVISLGPIQIRLKAPPISEPLQRKPKA